MKKRIITISISILAVMALALAFLSCRKAADVTETTDYSEMEIEASEQKVEDDTESAALSSGEPDTMESLKTAVSEESAEKESGKKVGDLKTGAAYKGTTQKSKKVDDKDPEVMSSSTDIPEITVTTTEQEETQAEASQTVSQVAEESKQASVAVEEPDRESESTGDVNGDGSGESSRAAEENAASDGKTGSEVNSEIQEAEMKTQPETEPSVNITERTPLAEKTTASETSAETEPETSHTHEFGEWVVVDEADCTGRGYKWRICACGEIENVYTDPLGHDWVPDYLDWDEDIYGELMYGICNFCHRIMTKDSPDFYYDCPMHCIYGWHGEYLIVETIRHEHEHVGDTCSRCGKYVSDGYEGPLRHIHDWQPEIVSHDFYVCEGCGETFTHEILTEDHKNAVKFENGVKMPYCENPSFHIETATLYVSRICSFCWAKTFPE